ncbi:MAG TPA: FtsX-like permease family protein [Acidobacteriota bacterium]|nr:FtsX-like permease family protein [Acidobacteriota bacterium]
MTRQSSLSDFHTLDQVKFELLAEERTLTLSFLGLGTVSWILVLTAVFGVVRLWTAWRTGEIGIRLALGSTPRRIIFLFLRRVSMLALAGLAIGLLAAYFATALLRSWLHGLEPTDAATFALSSALLFLTAVAGAALPAIDASRTDPVKCLRADAATPGDRLHA